MASINNGLNIDSNSWKYSNRKKSTNYTARDYESAKEELLNDEEFKKFRNQFNLNTPIKDVYDLYQKVHTKKPKAENPGSMRSSSQEGEKTFISEAEYDKMTDEEIEKNMDLIRKSMYKW